VFCEIDADRQPATHSQYGVSALPTILFLTKDGKVVDKQVGGLPLDALLQKMDAAKAAGGQ
jgi:thioredoxin-like negative regulator of GroEL